MNQHWINFLKSLIRHSRPQFDDPSLGLENESTQCSGEFGNPSGHSLMVTMIIPTMLDVVQSNNREWFRRHPCLSKLITLSAFIFILLVCLCRLYLGRHSVDQILLGCFFGFGMAHFCKNIFKPYFYEPVFWPSLDEDPKIVAARSRKAAIYAWLVYLFICVKIVLLYEYVERNAVIPQQWWDVIIQTCPIWKKAHTFHNFTLVTSGYVSLMPAHFLMNYLKHRRWAKTNIPPIEKPCVAWKAYCIEVVAKIVAFALAFFIVVKKAPIWIYGTSNIEPYPGFCKHFITCMCMALIGGPYTQMLRRKLESPARHSKSD